jgi:integrase
MACIKKRRGKWVLDFRDQNKRRHWETFNTSKAAKDALTELSKKLKDRTYVDPATLPTFAEVATAWLNTKRDHPSSTWGYWRTQVELHFIPVFGPLRIDQVTAFRIEEFRNAKRDGTGGHEPLARSTINQMLQTLTAILAYAAKHRYIIENPGKLVDRVRKNRKAGLATVQAVDPREVLTPEQAGLLVDAAEPGLYRTFIKTALLTGCRRGELLGLAWEHVDLEAHKLRIERSLAWEQGKERGYGKSKPVFGPPKSESSFRTLDLPVDLVHDLRVWKMQSRYKTEADLVFPNSLGKPLHGAFLHKGLAKARTEVNRRTVEQGMEDLPHVDLHGLRHTFGSIMLALGKPITQVSRLLGHKNPDLTMKVYAHWLKGESSASAMEDLATAISGQKRGSKVVANLG